MGSFRVKAADRAGWFGTAFLASALAFVPLASNSPTAAALSRSGLYAAVQDPVPATTLPLSLVYYGWHNATVDSQILKIAPQILIDNTPGGFWNGNCDSKKFQDAGIKVFSYIDAAYSTFSLTQNIAYIRAIAAEGTYGVFVDELSPQADSYLQTIYSNCQQLGVKLMVNPGMSSIDPNIYRYADFVMTDEQYIGRDPAPSETGNLSKTVVIGFKSQMTATQAAAYSNAAWSHGFGYTWHEQVEYTTLPSQTWLDTYLGLLTKPGDSNPATNNPPVLNPIGAKTTTQGSLLQFTIGGTDPDGNILTYSASNLPTGATFTSSTRTFSWTPLTTGNYPNVTFVVSDGSLTDSESISITVTSTNRPPVLNPIGAKTTAQGSLLQFTIGGTDPDGNILTYSASNLPTGATFTSSTRTFSWTPLTTGNYPNVTFVVSDGSLTDSESISITVTSTNRPPVLNPIGAKTTAQGSLLQFTIGGTDPDGNILTYSASNLPTGATFTNSTRTFSWTPLTTGNYPNVTFVVSDGSLTDSESISITVTSTNRPPVLNPIGAKTTAQGSLLQFTIGGTDPDGNILTYSASNLPTGATFTSSTRTFSWTPLTTGNYPNVTFVVSDGSLTDSESISITVSGLGAASVSGGGGGSYGGSDAPIALPAGLQPGLTSLSQYTTGDGTFRNDARASSIGNAATLSITAGTRFLNSDGTAASFVHIESVSEKEIPGSSDTYSIVSPVFNFRPAGAEFQPTALLSLAYDPSAIALGVDENTLVIGYWDSPTDMWMAVAATDVNTASAIVSALITDLRMYAVLAPKSAQHNIAAAPTGATADEPGLGITQSRNVNEASANATSAGFSTGAAAVADKKPSSEDTTKSEIQGPDPASRNAPNTPTQKARLPDAVVLSSTSPSLPWSVWADIVGIAGVAMALEVAGRRSKMSRVQIGRRATKRNEKGNAAVGVSMAERNLIVKEALAEERETLRAKIEEMKRNFTGVSANRS